MTTVEELEKFHQINCDNARKLIREKGKKYCGIQQKQGDTLYSRRIHSLLNPNKKEWEYSLERGLEKIMRLHSLFEQNIQEENDQEGIKDCIYDIINDINIAYKLYEEGNNNNKKIKSSNKKVDKKFWSNTVALED